jgi:uncharacterized protein (TIGR02145 family)
MMKNIFLVMTIALVIIAINSVAQTTDTFTDSRDGKTYKTATIGTQIWMVENLAFKTTSGCWAYNDDSTNVSKYGYLYSWATTKTVCPQGWHLPSDAEWTTLTNYLGEGVAKNKLKATTGWDKNGNGNNTSGFTALPGGCREIDGSYIMVGSSGYWWSSTENKTGSAWFRLIGSAGGNNIFRSSKSKNHGYSVRCIKD